MFLKSKAAVTRNQTNNIVTLSVHCYRFIFYIHNTFQC